jgi:hypothetical protein
VSGFPEAISAPDFLAEMTEDERLGPALVAYDRKADTIDIFGGESRFSRADPYWIPGKDLATIGGVLHWVAHLSEKSWAHTYKFWTAFADAVEARNRAHP